MIRSRLRRAAAGLAAAAVVAAALAVGGGMPASAVDVPGGPNFATIMDGFRVNGNLTSAGNGLLTCGFTCSLHETGSPGNNGFSMTYADVDTDPNTFNSSSAVLTIPAGATVAKAWLMWQSNAYSVSPTSGICGTSAGAGWQTQSLAAVLGSTPQISVDGGAYQNVGLADYTSQSLIVPRLYLVNGATDVTAELAGVGGGAHTITVANLVAQQGNACTAGWSLHVAYDYGQYIIGNPDSAARLLYTGFGSTVVYMSTQTVTFSGFRTASPGATLLMSVGDGEAPGGDTARVVWPGNATGESLANPLGSTTNLFNSIIDGDVSYSEDSDATFHNGSFDTFKTRSDLLPTGSTSVDFQFRSSNDGFYAHSVSMAVEVAQLRVTKLPGTGDVDAQIATTGEAPEYRIILNNDSAVAISSVEFDDANAVSCSLDGVPLVRTGVTYAVPDLAAGVEAIVLCTGPVVADGDASYVNTATARGLDPNGASVGPITDTTEILIPHLSLSKTVAPVVIVSGESVTWTMQVTNDGGTDLRDVVLTDTACEASVSAPSGPGAPTLLARGSTWTYTCTEALTADKSNTASVTASPFAIVGGEEITGDPVSDSDDAAVTVTAEPTPHLTVEKSVSEPLVDAGDTITWTMRVINDGGTDLRNVVLADPACTGTLSAPSGPGAPTLLGIGATWTYTCTEAVTADKTNTATATADSFRIIGGVDTPGPSVQGSDDASVQVTPAASLAVEKTVDDSLVAAGDSVTWTITATNDGDADLRNVVISDPGCTGSMSPPSGPGAPSLLAIGDTWTYTCTEALSADKTNTATVTGDSFRVVNGIEFVGPTATDSDDESVIVLGAGHVTLDKTVDDGVVMVGDTVTWSISAINDGGADLRGIAVTDTDCAGTLSGPSGPGAPDTLAVGDTWVYTCSEPISADKTNTASVSAQPFRIVDGVEYAGDEVSDSDTEEVVAFAPAHLTVTKSVDRPAVVSGESVTWTITALNDGEEELRDVVVSDTDCAGTVSAPSGPGAPDVLAVGDTWTYTCTEVLTAGKTNTATVTASSFRAGDGEDVDGFTVTGVAAADVTVSAVPPPLAVTGLDSSSASGALAAGALLLGAGALLVAFTPRRRRSS